LISERFSGIWEPAFIEIVSMKPDMTANLIIEMGDFIGI
jgi:hypothetical protein